MTPKRRSRWIRVAKGDRSAFYGRVYGHLVVAILAVVVLELVAFQTGFAPRLARPMLSVPWLLILSGFVVIGWLARRFAYRTKSLASQYVGLIGYALAKSIILVPLLYLADSYAPGAIQNAALFTLLGLVGLSLVVFLTRKDFTFLGAFLRWVGFLAFLTIIIAIVSGFRLGMWFDLGMIGLAGTSILYDTSKIIYRYGKDRYVAAALDLFASVALMFWYFLRFFRRALRSHG